MSVDEENAKKVAEGLRRAEAILAKNEFIIPGASMTEADIRLYTTILRFDPVYFGHFKCNLLAVRDCPNILRWLRQLSRISEVRETINLDHIKVSRGPSLSLIILCRIIITCRTSRSIPLRLCPCRRARTSLINSPSLSRE